MFARSRSSSPVVGHARAYPCCEPQFCTVCLREDTCVNDYDGKCPVVIQDANGITGHHLCRLCSSRVLTPKCPVCRTVMHFKSGRFDGFVEDEEDAVMDADELLVVIEGDEVAAYPIFAGPVWHPVAVVPVVQVAPVAVVPAPVAVAAVAVAVAVPVEAEVFEMDEVTAAVYMYRAKTRGDAVELIKTTMGIF